jgi:hypothetical protein
MFNVSAGVKKFNGKYISNNHGRERPILALKISKKTERIKSIIQFSTWPQAAPVNSYLK